MKRRQVTWLAGCALVLATVTGGLPATARGAGADTDGLSRGVSSALMLTDDPATRDGPVPMPRIEPADPGPIPMPQVRPADPGPVPMPRVLSPSGELSPLPDELRPAPGFPELE